MGLGNFLFFAIMAGVSYGIWKLLHLPSKPIEHIFCSMYRSTCPPHPEDWAVTHNIRIVRGLLWVLFGISSISALLGLLGVIAAIGVRLTH
jgi:hypothetical protein